MDAYPLTQFAFYEIPAGGSRVDIGTHAQVRYLWGSEDTITLHHDGRAYTLTRGAWIRGSYAGAAIEVTSENEAQVALELGLRQVDAIPLAPPKPAVEAKTQEKKGT